MTKGPLCWRRGSPKVWCIVELYGDGTWRPNRTFGTFTDRGAVLACASELRKRAEERRKETWSALRKAGVTLKQPKQRYCCKVVQCEIVPIASELTEEDLEFTPMAVSPADTT